MADIAPWHLHQIHVIIIIAWSSLQVNYVYLIGLVLIPDLTSLIYLLAVRPINYRTLRNGCCLFLYSVTFPPCRWLWPIHVCHATVTYQLLWRCKLTRGDNRAYPFTEMQRAFW
jgi:hypothetical protein